MNPRKTVIRADDRIDPYSSRGPSWFDGFAKPDVVAPGRTLIAPAAPGSTLAINHPELLVEDASGSLSYITLSGTSMATAVTSGIAAVVIAANRVAVPHRIPRCRPMQSRRFSSTGVRVTDGSRPALQPSCAGGGHAVNAGGAIELASAIDTSVSTRTWWLMRGVQPQTTFGSETDGWSQEFIWNNTPGYGFSIYINSPAWASNATWGDKILWGDNFVWGENILWGDNILWADNILWGDNIVYGARTSCGATTSCGETTSCGLTRAFGLISRRTAHENPSASCATVRRAVVLSGNPAGSVAARGDFRPCPPAACISGDGDALRPPQAAAAHDEKRFHDVSGECGGVYLASAARPASDDGCRGGWRVVSVHVRDAPRKSVVHRTSSTSRLCFLPSRRSASFTGWPAVLSVTSSGLILRRRSAQRRLPIFSSTSVPSLLPWRCQRANESRRVASRLPLGRSKLLRRCRRRRTRCSCCRSVRLRLYSVGLDSDVRHLPHLSGLRRAPRR